MWRGRQTSCSACPNLDFYLALPPRQLEISLDSSPQQEPGCRRQFTAAGLWLDTTPASLHTARTGHQSGNVDEWAGYTSDLLNMLDMLPEIHRNESIRVRYAIAHSHPYNQHEPDPNTKGSQSYTIQKVRRQCPNRTLPIFYKSPHHWRRTRPHPSPQL